MMKTIHSSCPNKKHTIGNREARLFKKCTKGVDLMKESIIVLIIVVMLSVMATGICENTDTLDDIRDFLLRAPRLGTLLTEEDARLISIRHIPGTEDPKVYEAIYGNMGLGFIEIDVGASGEVAFHDSFYQDTFAYTDLYVLKNSPMSYESALQIAKDCFSTYIKTEREHKSDKVTAYLEHYHLKALSDEDFVYWAHYYGDMDITTGWWYFLILPSRPNEGIEYWYNEDPISWGTVRIDALTGVYEIIETEDCFEWQ